MKGFVLLMGLVASSTALAIPFSATHFEMGSNQKKTLYTSKRADTVDGDKTMVRVVFSDPKGEPAVIEEATLLKGKLIRYSQDLKQINQSGFLEVKGDRVYFSYTKDGKTTTDDEKYKDNLVVGPTLMDYVYEQRAKIAAGDDVDVRFAVLDRKETVGFKFFKIGTGKVGDRSTLTLKMKPTSIVISALVDPLIFNVDPQNFRAYEIVGRTLPKVKDGDKWKDLDADSIYNY